MYKELPEVHILSPLTCFSKKRLFEELCNAASTVTGRPQRQLRARLNERENCGATICSNGVGMPHAVVPGSDRTVAVLAILPQSIPYNSIDSDYAGVDIAFAMFFAEDADPTHCSEIMQQLYEIFKNQDFVNSMRRIRHDGSKLRLITDRLDDMVFRAMHPTPVNVLHEISKEALEDQAEEEGAAAHEPRISTDSIALMVDAERAREKTAAAEAEAAAAEAAAEAAEETAAAEAAASRGASSAREETGSDAASGRTETFLEETSDLTAAAARHSPETAHPDATSAPENASSSLAEASAENHSALASDLTNSNPARIQDASSRTADPVRSNPSDLKGSDISDVSDLPENVDLLSGLITTPDHKSADRSLPS